jgi:chemotaxis protein MotB
MRGILRRTSRVDRVRTSRDRWLVAYADMVTLLMACFASLYASTLDHPAPTSPVAQAGVVTLPLVPKPSDEALALRLALEGIIAREGEIAAIEVTIDARGLVISLPESGSFPPGSAVLTPAAQRVVRAIAVGLHDTQNPIRIEGHTDDVPIATTEFKSNWELSTARATHVVQFLIEDAGVPPARMSAAGYGQYRPRVPNDSAQHRSRNRRIDIVVLGTVTAAMVEPVVGAMR